MEPGRMQFGVAGLLGLVACVAVNVWLFRLGLLWGIIGLSVTKHVVIAYLCQVLGVDRRVARSTLPHRTVVASPPPVSMP